MLFIVLSGIVGAGATFFALWPYGLHCIFGRGVFRGPRGPVIGPAVGGLPATRHDNLP
jgi:hypothetical protein